MEDGKEGTVDRVELGNVAAEVNATISASGKPIMIWKLGSEARGWIPNRKHFDAVRDFIKKAKLEDRYDVFIYHFGVDVKILYPRPWWKRILG